MNGKKNSFFDDFEDIKKPNKKIFSDNNVFELKDIKDIKDIKKINTEENGKINEYSGFTISNITPSNTFSQMCDNSN